MKPKEYTRIDKLIELIFLTTKDLQLVEQADEQIDELEEVLTEKRKRKPSEDKATPVNFHEECLLKIQTKLGLNLIKQTRSSYANKEKLVGLICAISKVHKQGQFEKFWFAYHPYQNEFLKTCDNAYVALGCGSPKNLFLIPYKEFEPFIKNFWTTENEERMYWHIVIHLRENRFFIAQPVIERGNMIDITKHKL